MNKNLVDFFTKEHAERYDEKNKNLSPISNNLHFLISLVLKNLPAKAKVLSVGAGTGAEILTLAKIYPEWTFVAVEPSESMLNVCRERITQAGYANRCELIHGYAQDLPSKAEFDAALAILVAHFVKRPERVNFYKSLAERLRSGGLLINAEISFDLDSAEYPSILENWKHVQSLMGATPESLDLLPQLMKDTLTVVSIPETEQFLSAAGINLPARFFQAFMISAWYGVKN